MHRLKKMVLCTILGAAAVGLVPMFDRGQRSVQAAGADFLYFHLWGWEVCWSDCAEGAVCCKLVYLVEEE